MIYDPQPGVPRANILLVDDDPSNLVTLGNLLDAHYDILAAPSGERALQIASGTPRPDLILLDVLMPDMDGYAVLARLSANPATHGIPVIFVTGLDSSEEEEKGLELGAVDYIAKPYRPPIILARIRAQLELKRARDWLANQNEYLGAELNRRLKENQQAQSQLLQSEKLAAIGQLAAGVAHEINNPVGYVTSNLGVLDSYMQDTFELLDAYSALEEACPTDTVALTTIRRIKQEQDSDSVRQDIVQLIAESRQGLQRISKIVGDLKNFARVESEEWQETNLHDGLDSTLNIVWNEIKYHCTVHKHYGDLPVIICISSQINQVLLNLLVNAAQAITGKGEITIRTGLGKDEVFISISDTGSGISTEVLPRLFEPFFTTKPIGKGTGLGLSIAYGIVKKHGGRIEVDSALGKGTTFTVWLPLKPPTGDAARSEA